MTAFRPSQVVLEEIPLVGTFGRVEREAAATLLVRTCVRGGDTWRPVTMKELGAAGLADIAEKVEPQASLNHNPFWRPDFRDLVKHGYAACTFEPGSAIEFTAKGLEALARWVRKDGAT